VKKAPESELEAKLETHIASQLKINSENVKNKTEIDRKLDQMQAHMKNMDKQIAQIAETLNNMQKAGSIPGQPQHQSTSPQGQLNAITTRSGKQTEDPPMPVQTHPTVQDSTPLQEEEPMESDVANDLPKNKSDPKQKPIAKEPAEYIPPLPFLGRQNNARLDKQFRRFVEILNGFQINIPFVEAMIQMPNYAKFLKDILSKKRTIDDVKTVNLTQEISDALFTRLLRWRILAPFLFHVL
jgi:hypothetical protein